MASTAELWTMYRQAPTPAVKRDLVMAYMNLIRYVVARLHVPASEAVVVKEDDLVQYGVIGLLEAIERYDHARGIKFETFAVPRIRGAIQDELRKLDWVPRSVRKKARDADRILRQVEAGVGAVAGATARRLALTLDEYLGLVRDTEAVRADIAFAREEEEGGVDTLPSDDDDQLEMLGNEELRATLRGMVEKLPERERIVLSLYYYEGLTFKEIAAVLNISDSRVFQVHAGVLRRLREQLSPMV